MASIRAATGRNLKNMSRAQDISASVYGELKLSSKLADELESIKSAVDDLNERLEVALYERDSYKSQLYQVRAKEEGYKKQIETLKKGIKDVKHQNNTAVIQCENILRGANALADFVKISEQFRKRFSESLRECKALNDLQANEIFELDQSKKLFKIQYDEVKNQLMMIYESVTAITDAKALEDNYKMEIQKLKEHTATLLVEKKEALEEKIKIVRDKDQLREDLKDLNIAKKKLDNEFRTFKNVTKEAFEKHQNDFQTVSR